MENIVEIVAHHNKYFLSKTFAEGSNVVKIFNLEH